MMITGKARIAGVMGWPVDHSRSPQLHNFWLHQYGIDGAYIPLAVTPEDFPTAVHALAGLRFAGVNITVPHKEAALAVVDEAEPNARRIGAVNTIVIDAEGRLVGSNTDGFGFMENLRAGAPGWSAEDGPAVVLGAGGAARAIAAALQQAGAPEIRIVNRTAARARELARDLGAPLITAPWEQRAAALDGAALVVNATTLGMSGNPPLDISLDAVNRDAVVTDIVYVPLRTGLLAAARGRGLRAVDGIGMLLHQARPAFAAWFGHQPEVNDALRAHVLNGLE
jgi:shikimate dehydrogenase